jgi:glycerophosphoryl diester phosphodiesterase
MLCRVCAVIPIVVFASSCARLPIVRESAKPVESERQVSQGGTQIVHLGPRPFFLVDEMTPGPLQEKLKSCNGPFHPSAFSIGHRGAALQFPEHTEESYRAAARMGAGIIECDVTFTADRQLVCRHSQCDLHATTNILSVPELAAKCTEPFKPAEPITGTAASAKCCTSDITLSEFKGLCGKMDGNRMDAVDVSDFMEGTPDWRTELYSGCGTLMTHRESIDLFVELGVKMTPEQKTPEVVMPFQGDYSQEDFTAQLLAEYGAAGVPAEDVYFQSFKLEDIAYLIENEPLFAENAVMLDGRYAEATFDPGDSTTWTPSMDDLASLGIKTLAPPLWVLLHEEEGRVVPTAYADAASAAGLALITWTLERSGRPSDSTDWYYQSTPEGIQNEGDVYQVLDVLAQQVGVRGVFSDWPATTTFYENCIGETSP